MNDVIEPVMTVKEIGEIIGKSRSTVYEMLKAGDIPCQRGTHGGPIVPRAMFRRYLDGTWTKPAAATDRPLNLVQRRQAS